MKSSLLHFLVLVLALSFLLSIAAVPTSRSLKYIAEKPSIHVQDLQAQELMVEGGDMLMVEGLVEGRMVLESNDYPGTGANNHHDPRSPRRN